MSKHVPYESRRLAVVICDVDEGINVLSTDGFSWVTLVDIAEGRARPMLFESVIGGWTWLKGRPLGWFVGIPHGPARVITAKTAGVR